MDLFEAHRLEQLARTAPLALRMRPRTFDEFAGQEEIVGPGKILRRAVERDQLFSLIFYGPPGTGKTTLAGIIANTTRAHFAKLSAVTASVTDLRQVFKEARERAGMYHQRTVLFIDEIHRFNKAQQDALLPVLEEGAVVLIGATTENPYFEVNSALVSRARIFRLRQLQDDDVRRILERGLADRERGLGGLAVEVITEAMDHWVRVAAGDARSALNALELAVMAAEPGADGVRRITLADAEDAIQQRTVLYDKSGDQHYDVISALIKSMRGSDPDAALYWLARMVIAGEDPSFIARRMMIHAAEDVGIADPRALLVATAAAQAVERVGWPEGRIILAEAALYIALAPKSNAVVRGINEAMSAVEQEPTGPVPPHLRDASYRGAAALGHGQGYKYPHDYPGGRVAQNYLPDGLTGRQFYHPTDYGEDKATKPEEK